MTPSSLPTHKFEPCTECNGQAVKQRAVFCNCQGHGVEPVEVENPCLFEAPKSIKDKGLRELWVLNKIAQAISEGKPTHQLQLGKVFTIGECDYHLKYQPNCPTCNEMIKQFLPIRPVKEGDLSKVWVVKV